MLDYHLHLWPHGQRDDVPTLERIAAYCEKAQSAGVAEIALTEHLFRFKQADRILRGFWDGDRDQEMRSSMQSYWDQHVGADLDVYVETVIEAKRAGLPVVLGLEVDYYKDRMGDVSDLLSGYPFDVLLGSVHWLGTWRFDDLDDPTSMAKWPTRKVDDVWDEYTSAIEELAETGACDVLAHPDLIKLTGTIPEVPNSWWDRIVECAVASNIAAEVSSAGWRKPVAEQYPASGLLARLVAAGVPLTTASDAHGLPDVAYQTERLRDMLKNMDVTHLRGFRGRKAVDLPLVSAKTGATSHGGATGPDRDSAVTMHGNLQREES